MQCHYNTIIDAAGNGVNGAAVYVYKQDLITLATVYSDDGVTSTANPIICDALGRFYFYAGNGKYNLKISGAGITTYWIKGVCLYDPSVILPSTNLTLLPPWVAVIGLYPQIIRSGDTVNISGTFKGGSASSTFAYIPDIHKPINSYLDFPATNFNSGAALSISVFTTSLILQGTFSATDTILFGLAYQAQSIV